ncbi:MAG: ATP-binding cassette domain-containing protein [Phycisphaeraceae bacterium]|nr:ATP-binding cassette domain-containing protein [Phycisphaeraceae bacterium]
MTAPAISISGVRKQFRETIAVRDLDLRIDRGTLCGFLGPNGAGKSTTIRMIMSIIHPDSGRVEVLGGSALDAKDRIGYLPEERGVYRKMRVSEFLRYMGRLKGLTRQDADHRAAAWLARLELAEVLPRRCEELSKGMQQKVQFVAAVIHSPELLILDEPFSGLDPVNARLMASVVRDISASGATILFSTHQMSHAEQLCNRVVLINHGLKILDATHDEIAARFDPRTIVLEPLPGAAMNGRMQAIEQDIRRIDGVHDLTWSESGRRAELALAPNADSQAIMSRALALLPLRSIEVARVSLDDVFVQLVGGGPRPSEGGEGGD